MEIKITSSKKITLNQDFAKAWLRDYKDFALPALVILGCILVLIFIVIPQVNQFFVSKKQLDYETQKLSVLKNNYNFLLSLDENKANDDLKVLSKTLPAGKDFIGILSALSAVSSKTNVSIGNFSFSLGDLSKNSQATNLSSPIISIDVGVNGDAQSIIKFINELNNTAPLSEVTVVKGTANANILTIIFHYKPFPPQNISDEKQVPPISSDDKAFINDLYSWNNISDDSSLFSLPDVSSSSSSAGTNPSPF